MYVVLVLFCSLLQCVIFIKLCLISMKWRTGDWRFVFVFCCECECIGCRCSESYWVRRSLFVSAPVPYALLNVLLSPTRVGKLRAMGSTGAAAAALATRPTRAPGRWIWTRVQRDGGGRLGGGAVPRGHRQRSRTRVRRAPRPTRRARRLSVQRWRRRRGIAGHSEQRAHRHSLRQHVPPNPIGGRHRVRSFARTDADAEWRECHSLDVQLTSKYSMLRAVSDGRSLVVGDADTSCARELRVFAVDSSRAMHQSRSIQFSNEYYGFDVKLAGGEIWLAVVLFTPSAGDEDVVVLLRVGRDGDESELRSERPVPEPRTPLFCRDSLLVCAVAHNGWEVLEFGTGGGRLEPRRVVHSGLDFPAFHPDWFSTWCVVNDALVAWDFEPDTLMIYSLL